MFTVHEQGIADARSELPISHDGMMIGFAVKGGPVWSDDPDACARTAYRSQTFVQPSGLLKMLAEDKANYRKHCLAEWSPNRFCWPQN